MLHTNFQGHLPFGFREVDFFRFLPYELRHDKTNKVNVRPAKTQISLGIRWAHTHFVGFVMLWLNYMDMADLLVM